MLGGLSGKERIVHKGLCLAYAFSLQPSSCMLNVLESLIFQHSLVNARII